MSFLKLNFSFGFLLLGFLAFSQSSKIEVKCSSQQILLGNSIRIEFHLNNVEGQFNPPIFENCEVSGPSFSSQIQNINGEVSQRKSYIYLIKPNSEGTFIIPSAELLNEEETLLTEEIQIIVKANPEGIIEEIPQGESFFQQWSFDKMPKQEKVESENSIKKNKRKRRKI